MNFQIKKPTPVREMTRFGGTCMGRAYGVTNRYMTRDGKPFVYRMGEIHFSRIPREDWETELRKMKAGGIEIAASYLFWIHHEESEGEFDFSGNRDLRAFCLTCKKVGMPFFLRLGPWAHGEARNGGFPDWLLKICGGKENTRTNSEPYLTYVRRYFERVFEEIRDCMDTVIGIQVENELHRNAPHMETLRQMIEEIGFRAPIWTATGWGPGGSEANIPEGVLIPVYGGYPEAPWTMHTEPIRNSDNFFFSKKRDSAWIGTDIFGMVSQEQPNKARSDDQNYPYLTCEVGGGNQVTYHRRPIITARDLVAGVICKLGSGANGIGYYMYHGGKNPIGKTTMQESRATGYKNDYPIVSYDFQSPLGECGQIRDSYYALKTLHDFLELCGETLAPMTASLPDCAPVDLFDQKTLRCAVRSDGIGGFFFFNNHVHNEKMNGLCEDITISMDDGSTPVSFSLNVPAGCCGIMPIRYPIGDIRAEWISAIPVEKAEKALVFEEIEGLLPQICLQDGQILDLRDEPLVGGVRLKLREKQTAMKQTLVSVPLAISTDKLPNTVFAHIENRDGTPLEAVETVDYTFTLPKNTSYLEIHAYGNAAAIYHGDKLLGDFYLYGDAWVVDVRNVPDAATLTLKILPLTEQNKNNVYFEYDMPLGVVEPQVYVHEKL